MSGVAAAPAARIAGLHAGAAQLAALAGRGARIRLGDGRRRGAMQSGRLASRLRGRGMEFAESRVYTPGDDVRSMDWRVTARTGTPHTKVYEEERERPVLVLVDFGPSMFFGTRVALKSVLAAETAALLAWAAVLGGDRAGVITFGIRGLGETRPTGGRRGALACIRALARDGAPPPAGETPPAGATLQAALLHARRVCRPGTLVFLVSDLYGLDEACAHHLGHLRRHSDVVACRCVDPLEAAPPPAARLALGDGRERLRLDTGNAVTASAWRAHFAARGGLIRDLLRLQSTPLVELATDCDVTERLRASLGGATAGRSPSGPAGRAA